MRREMIDKGKRSKVWRLTIQRASLVGDVLSHFERDVAKKKAAQASVILFSSTVVTFIDRMGEVELGSDQGGLTAELVSCFWREVVQPEMGLFEACGDARGVLPRADAPLESLTMVGLIMCK